MRMTQRSLVKAVASPGVGRISGFVLVLCTLLSGCGGRTDEPEEVARPPSANLEPSVAQAASDEVALQSAGQVAPAGAPKIEDFFLLGEGTKAQVEEATKRIAESWHPGCTVMLLEVWRFSQGTPREKYILELLESNTGQSFGRDPDQWYRWLWSQPSQPHPDYAEFKKRLYSMLDPRFAEYFAHQRKSLIRLDEIRWGGVKRDGIPPLKDPQVLPAGEASYLADTDVVFGVTVNEASRAYPKRILAWHEMVKDHLGGESINGVYCTLCGSMIVYFTELGEGSEKTHYELGTSGFLYRSNKLMYDQRTKSMWSTLEGRPVMGPLVEQQIQLRPHHVVTTTWGEWKARHPDTDVLSLDTGHRRDYGEGVAYRDYFSTDQLMFSVPKQDGRLKNKDEVFVVRGRTQEGKPVAIHEAFLAEHPIYVIEFDDAKVLILTDASGANRAYEIGERSFKLEADALLDSEGRRWNIGEDQLVREDGKESLPRLASHRAFWFGWFAGHPATHLIH